MGLQFLAPLHRHDDWSDIERAVGMEPDHIGTAICGPYLILRSDSFLNDFLFDANGFLGQALGRGDLSTMGAHHVEEADGERRTRSHTRTCRQVAVVLNLYA